VNTVNGANVHAGGVFGSDTGVRDHEGHSGSLHKKRSVWE
jgi:hypothetical protein